MDKNSGSDEMNFSDFCAIFGILMGFFWRNKSEKIKLKFGKNQENSEKMAIITKIIFVIFRQFLGIFGTFLEFLKINSWIKSLQKSKKIQFNLEK